MDAEITINAKDPIDDGQYLQAIKASFPSHRSLNWILERIDERLRDTYRNVELLRWHASKSRILLVERLMNGNVCKFYIIAIGDRGLPRMRESIHEVVTVVESLLKRKFETKASEVKITINSDGITIQQLRKTSWWQRFKKNISDSFITKLIVPLMVLGLSVLFSIDIGKAAIAAGASAIGFFIWLLISPGIISRSFPYEEEKEKK